MAKRISKYLITDICNQMGEMYFPKAVMWGVIESVPKLWDEYLEKTFGKIPEKVAKTDYRINFKTNDPYINSFFLKSSYEFREFKGTIVNLPCLRWTKEKGYELDIDICPVEEIKDSLLILADMAEEKEMFETLLCSELLKSSTLESFVKKFPETKASLAQWLDEECPDLPKECAIDMSELLGEFAK